MVARRRVLLSEGRPGGPVPPHRFRPSWAILASSLTCGFVVQSSQAAGASFGAMDHECFRCERISCSFGCCCPYSIAMPRSAETFPNPPLKFVVCEVRFEGRTAGEQELHALRSALGEGSQAKFNLPGMRVVDPSVPPETAFFQVVDRAETRAATLWPTALTLEATDYSRFEDFSEVMAAMFRAFVGSNVLLVQRVGLRYVDELHPEPPPSRPADWSRWVDGRLVDFAQVTEKAVSALGGGMTISYGDDYALNFRYATTDGPGTQSNGALKIRVAPNSPGLVLDTDAFWQPKKAVPLEAGGLASVLDRLHDHVAEVFSAAVTDASRAVFREEPK